METFAVYWEPIIKTYGMAERTGLVLITAELPQDRLCDGGMWLSRMAERFAGDLILIFARPAAPSGLSLHLLLDRLPDHAGASIPAEPDDIRPGLRVDNGVELVYFQGPHYGDRYGIAAAAVTALVQHGVPILSVVCTGASVYLVTPKGKASAARKALSSAFSSPDSVTSPTNS